MDIQWLGCVNGSSSIVKKKKKKSTTLIHLLIMKEALCVGEEGYISKIYVLSYHCCCEYKTVLNKWTKKYTV